MSNQNSKPTTRLSAV